MNPYREAFYARQAQWHHYEGPEHVRGLHETRARYYDWFLRDWLPGDLDSTFLDIGCGSGQFLYFLKKKGYKNARGIDLDGKQIEIAQALELEAEQASIFDFLVRSERQFDAIAMLDIIEHFTREELFPLMEAVVRAAAPGRTLDRQRTERGKPRRAALPLYRHHARDGIHGDVLRGNALLSWAQAREPARPVARASGRQTHPLPLARAGGTGRRIDPAPLPRLSTAADLVQRDVGAGNQAGLKWVALALPVHASGGPLAKPVPPGTQPLAAASAAQPVRSAA